MVEDFDPDVHLDTEGEPTPETIKRVGRRVIDELQQALASSETDTIEVAGYRLYLSGGLSSGDSPTDAADAIWHAHHLPVTVLLAMGLIPDCRRPLSRTSGNPGPVTDTDIVDAIALGLGTKPEWSGADELEWIANAIGSVRPHPGDRDPAEYHAEFTEQHGFDPVDDNFLIGYVSQYDNQEGGD